MEALNWIKFINYIKDFTMIKEKDLNYVKLADNYLSYAISLREAKNIEKYINTNETYHNFIYSNLNEYNITKR